MAGKPIYAVLTGDVIASRKSDPEHWLSVLKEVLAQFGSSPKYWDIHRGDAFQVLICDAGSALNAAMKLKAGFKSSPGLDLRMAIGLGTLSFESNRIGESSGEAFIRSGALIEKLNSRQTNLAIASPWPEFDEELNPGLALFSALMDKWRPTYAQSMAAYLSEPELTQESLGVKLGIAQNTFSERQSKAYRRELVNFETMYKIKLNKLIARTVD